MQLKTYNQDALDALAIKFANDTIFADGFDDDIADAKVNAVEFLANPSEFRPVFGNVASIPSQGQSMHTTALLAAATNDITYANSVVTEILAIVNATDLEDDFWEGMKTTRWGDHPNLMIQVGKIKKMKDSFYLLKDLETVLTGAERISIDLWFETFKDISFAGMSYRIDGAFGDGWTADYIPSGGYFSGEVTIEGASEPIQDADGNTLFITTQVQDFFNNRNYDILTYIHSAAVTYGDIVAEQYIREFVKLTLKYGVFPDGTNWEMNRATADDPYKGIWYSWITLTSLALIAHLDALEGSFPDDLLYDYSTTDGVLNGSTTITKTAYAGTSTTDGVTPKSILSFAQAISKYYRSEANGGWNDVRFSYGTALNPEGYTQPSTHIAILNLWYKSQDLEDFYTYNTSVGYPAKQDTRQGYLAGYADMSDDMGGWGALITYSMWLGMGDYFFQNVITTTDTFEWTLTNQPKDITSLNIGGTSYSFNTGVLEGPVVLSSFGLIVDADIFNPIDGLLYNWVLTNQSKDITRVVIGDITYEFSTGVLEGSVILSSFDLIVNTDDEIDPVTPASINVTVGLPTATVEFVTHSITINKYTNINL